MSLLSGPGGCASTPDAGSLAGPAWWSCSSVPFPQSAPDGDLQ